MILLTAWAQEAPEAPDGPVSEEVIVYGELRVQRARAKVIEELKNMGYKKQIDKDGATVMRHPDTWKGDIWLHDDGWMRIKRQPVQYRVPRGPLGPLACVLVPFTCLKTGGQMVGRRKFMAQETRVVGMTQPRVNEWGDRMADLSVDRKQETLPARLEALWRNGTPLDESGVVVESTEARKAAILKFWETRTENAWGQRIRQTVESFIRGEIQGTEDAFTDQEITDFNRRSRAGRDLDLRRRRLADE